MRDHFQSPSSHADPTLIRADLVREFERDDLDVDDLVSAIRRLLDFDEVRASEDLIPVNSALHSFTNRASHVMGSGAADPA